MQLAHQSESLPTPVDAIQTDSHFPSTEHTSISDGMTACNHPDDGGGAVVIAST